MLIEFSRCIGRLDNEKDKLTIISPSSGTDGVFLPAQDIVIYGAKDLRKLRDALIEAYPSAKSPADLYEKLRKLSPAQFTELYKRNLLGENFDEMVDAL